MWQPKPTTYDYKLRFELDQSLKEMDRKREASRNAQLNSAKKISLEPSFNSYLTEKLTTYIEEWKKDKSRSGRLWNDRNREDHVNEFLGKMRNSQSVNESLVLLANEINYAEKKTVNYFETLKDLVNKLHETIDETWMRQFIAQYQYGFCDYKNYRITVGQQYESLGDFIYKEKKHQRQYVIREEKSQIIATLSSMDKLIEILNHPIPTQAHIKKIN